MSEHPLGDNEQLDNAAQSAEDALEDAQESVEETISESQEAVEESVDEAQEAVAEAEEAVEEAVEDAQETAKEAIAEAEEAVEEAVDEAQEAAEEAIEDAQETAEEAIAEAEEAVEEAVDEAEEAVAEAEEAVEEAVEDAQETAEEAIAEAEEAVEEAVDEAEEAVAEAEEAVEEAVEDAQETAEEAIAEAEEAVEEAVDEAQEAAEEAIEDAQETAEEAIAEAEEAVEEAVDEAQEAAEEAIEDAQETAEEAIAEAEEAVAEAEEAVEEAIEDAQETAEEAIAEAEEAVEEAVDEAEEAVAEAEEAVEEAIEDAQETAEEAIAEAEEAVEEAVDEAEEMAEEAIAEAEEAVEEAIEDAQETAEEAIAEAEEAVEEAVDEAQEAVEETIAEAEEAAEEAIAEAEEAVEEAVDEAQEAAEEAIAEAEEAVEEAVDEAQEMAEEAIAEAEEAVEEAVDEAQEMAEEAITEAEEAVEGAIDEAEQAIEEAVAQAQAAAEEAVAQAQAAAEEALASAQELASETLANLPEPFDSLPPPPPLEPPSLPGLNGNSTEQKPSRETFIPQFYIELNGQQVPPKLMSDMIEIRVEDNLYLPDMFTLYLSDAHLEWINADTFSIGSTVKITAQSSSANVNTQAAGPQAILIQGEITGLEPDLIEGGETTLLVRGFDRSHRLHQGRYIRSFLESTDSEIAQKIATDAQLSAEVDPTNTVYEHVVQNNQTNMEFLQARARQIGYQLYVEDETLFFKQAQPNEAETEAITLTWGSDLLNFRPALAAVHQVEEVEVRGWDVMTKKEVIGRATNSEVMPDIPSKNTLSDHFKGANKLLISQPVEDQAQADSMAQAIRDELGGELIQADGRCIGNPQIQVGTLINIAGLGEQFSGKYFVTEAIHSYSTETGYETHFRIGGRNPHTVNTLLGLDKGAIEKIKSGVMVGLVTNNKDPEGLGRIKVKYPALDDTDESPWVRVASPMAGEERGFFYLPEVNDEVLIAFEQGHVQRPYMLGMLWNGKDKPPLSDAVGGDGLVNQRLIKSRSGHEILLDDTSGQEKVLIRSQSGHEIILDDGNKNIIVSDGSNEVKLTASEMTIKVEGSLKLNANNEISLKSSGNLKIEAGGMVTVKGATIDLN